MILFSVPVSWFERNQIPPQNLALYMLDGNSDKGRYHTELFGSPEVLDKLMKDTGAGRRNALMWAGLAFGSLVNHNLSKPEMAGYLTNIKIIVGRVIELDAAHAPENKVYAALPHIALGMVNSAVGAALGGDPKKAADEFQMALTITGDKMLLARSLMGYRVGVMTNDRKFFHDQLKQVLETPPSVWPEQRLANEVAHRRARRYLSHEKELFQ